MFVLGFLLPFLLGVFVTISIAVVLLLYWFYRQPLSKCNAARFPQYVKPSRNEVKDARARMCVCVCVFVCVCVYLMNMRIRI